MSKLFDVSALLFIIVTKLVNMNERVTREKEKKSGD